MNGRSVATLDCRVPRRAARDRRRTLRMVLCSLALLWPTGTAAQSIVDAAATPNPFTSGATITINATVAAGDSPEPWCIEWQGCYIVGAEPYLQVVGSNGFNQITYDWDAQWFDSNPGQTMQPTTYTVYGGVTWTVCYGFYYCEEYDSYGEDGQDQTSVTPTAIPSPDSVSPSTGSGLSQTFTLQYSSAIGAQDIAQGWLWFSPSIGSGDANSCVILYTRSTHTLSLLDDAGTTWLVAPVGSPGPGVQNTQCAVYTTQAGASTNGNILTVNVPVAFSPGYIGLKRIYMAGVGQSGSSSGWQDRGSWDPLCLYSVTPTSSTVSSSGGSLNVSVTTSPWCQWTAVSGSGFLNLTGGGGSTGSGSATYSYATHGGSEPRSSQVTVAGAPVSVMQSGDVPAASETVLYYHTDALGSVRVLTNASGQTHPNAQTRYDYLPFGTLWLEPTFKEKRLFTGQERDGETDFDYFGARHYTRAIERFTSPDPITVTPSRLLNPSRLNRYVYAANNPLRFVDRDGRYEEDVHFGLTYALARAAGYSSWVAEQIALANHGVDVNPYTRPMFGAGSGVGQRRDYHFTDQNRRDRLLHLAERYHSLQFLGTFLHAFQDSFSHAGYGPIYGHLFDGHEPDKTYNDPEKALEMARKTYEYLLWAGDLFPNVGVPLPWEVFESYVRQFNEAKTKKEKDAILNEFMKAIDNGPNGK